MKEIYKNKYFLFLMLLFFFKPICFQYYSSLQWLENLFVYGKIFVATLVIVQSLLSMFPKLKIDRFLCSVFIFCCWMLIITVLFKGNIFRMFIDFVSVFVLVLTVVNAINVDAILFCRIFKRLVLFFLFLQFFSEIVYPNGMPADLYHNNETNPIYFMTIDNGITGLVILGLLLVTIEKKIYIDSYKRRWKYFLDVSICVATALFSGSTTARLCTIGMLLFICILQSKNNIFFEKKWMWISMYISLFVMIVFGENSYIYELIMTLTGKSGYTGRTYLWSISIKTIVESPIIGYGRLNHDYLSVWGGYFSSHNTILEILLQGGIVALILWSFMVYEGLRNVKKINDGFSKRLLLCALFIILIALLFEATIYSVYFFSILAMLYGISKYENKFYRKDEGIYV